MNTDPLPQGQPGSSTPPDPGSSPPPDPASPPDPGSSTPRTGDPADLWATVDALRAWLDAERVHDGLDGLLLHVLKLSEEVGEVAQAVIGATGQNPRKGVTHTWDDVRSELCDVIITALVALRTLTPDAQEVFAAHLARVAERSLDGAGEPRETKAELR
ncbi:MazG-like family protein [Streptomyces sp. NPDC054884]|uniref:MazG-like family protein n=1 Tax=Streptomyces sp. ME08-AFT2 TaxID=3028683 RepID=UPI0029B748B3|nr:MazG-like family protein [Streptomyces sp. ME08-AFT2]MDX3312247.1 MazG-like family protein [Streptomyces sp. ME08-AFT2]